ncbi:MAG: hypothetical protein ACRDRI_01475 [Pseudonocardiaceae bacterium]
MNERGRQSANLKGFFVENFAWIDAIKMGLSALLGYGLKALLETGTRDAGASIVSFVAISFAAVVAVDRFRVTSEMKLQATHDQLNGELERNLNHVHAAVEYALDRPGLRVSRNGVAGYDRLTKEVKRATRQILVLGDYSPPPDAGAALDPPRYRAEYFDAIEERLRDRLEREATESGRALKYYRIIQRPLDVYDNIRQRERGGGVVLKPSDMIGDVQAFKHCVEVLKIAKFAADRNSTMIDIKIHLIPFLPNCPSMLIVDNSEVAFTIPTRIDQPVDNYAQQGLHGVLLMQDKANGSQLCAKFEDLFNRLTGISQIVRKVEEDSQPESTGGS